MKSIRSRCILWAVLTLSLLAPFASHAEHEADHRYLIFGAVQDASGQPRANQKVEVVDGDTTLASTQTNSQGEYRVTLHLHDEDLGRRLNVVTGDKRIQITVQFEAGDKTTQRGHRVDFIGRNATDTSRAGSGYGIPPALYYVAAVVGIIVLLSLAGRHSKRKAQRARSEQGSSKAKKRRKKHH